MEKEVGKSEKKKTVIIDTISSTIYSLIVGSILDAHAGLNTTGIISSRVSSIPVNAMTGGAYGWWREQIFNICKTKEASNIIRKTVTDLIAFNTFQVPLYGAIVTGATYISEQKIDLDKTIDGMIGLATTSPIIGVTMGITMNIFRKINNLPPVGKQ